MALSISRLACAYFATTLLILFLAILYAAKSRGVSHDSTVPLSSSTTFLQIDSLRAGQTPRPVRDWWTAELGTETLEYLERVAERARKRETENPERETQRILPRPTSLGTECLELFDKAGEERIHRKPTLPPRTLVELNTVVWEQFRRDIEDEVAPKYRTPEFINKSRAESALNIYPFEWPEPWVDEILDYSTENAVENMRAEYREHMAELNSSWISKFTLDMKSAEYVPPPLKVSPPSIELNYNLFEQEERLIDELDARMRDEISTPNKTTTMRQRRVLLIGIRDRYHYDPHYVWPTRPDGWVPPAPDIPIIPPYNYADTPPKPSAPRIAYPLIPPNNFTESQEDFQRDQAERNEEWIHRHLPGMKNTE